MNHIHQASVRLFVPEGFAGWWCERCQKPVEIEDTLGSPARCPKCHKATAVWVPPGENREIGKSGKRKAESGNWERKYVTQAQGAQEFAAMRALIEDVVPESGEKL